MIATVVLGLVNLFCTGILAGEELVIYYGVRTPLASLDERPQTLLRQALIRRLRILVPAIFVPSILLGVAVTVLGGKSSKPAWQGFLGFFRIDLVPVVLVSVVPVVLRSSCVISSWLQYF